MIRPLPIILLAIFVTACASKPRPQQLVRSPATTRVATSTSRPADDPASLSLNDLPPLPRRVSTHPVSEPTGPAPIESLELYARARDAILQNQRYTAITLLEKAIALDPYSYELRYSLGQAYGGVGPSNDQAIAAYEAAADMEPNHLDLQAELGRQYLAKGNFEKAIEHLRRAINTYDYRHDDPMSAVAEYFLARALQGKGYDQAAIDVYERLLDRLERRGIPSRLDPQLGYLLNQPEAVSARLAELYEKRGQYDAAIKAYDYMRQRRPEVFDVNARIVGVLLKAGRNDEASSKATDAVVRFKASNESLDLLKEVYKDRGGDNAVADQLLRLHREKPDDRSILYALVDFLTRTNRQKEAESILEDQASRRNYEPQIVRQLFKLYESRNATDAGARLLVIALAKRPDSIRDLGEMWTALLRASTKNRLSIARLQAVKVPPEAQASKLLWISRLAQLWGRDILARNSLEQSVKLTPPFAPAYRVLVVEYATRADWDSAKQQRETDSLIQSVRAHGDSSLAAELEGLRYLTQGKAADAARSFERAMKLGGNSIDLRLSYATALRMAGDGPRSEQVLWNLVQDQPGCEDAYASLFRTYIEGGAANQAMPVLKKWLSNNPNSINARVVQAAVMLQARQQEGAKKILLDLFERNPESPDVLNSLVAFYERVGNMDELFSKLEAERTRHPNNRVAIEELVTLYAQQKRLPDATRVLDAARAAVAGDPDLLYYVGALYSRIGQRETQEQILQEIIKLDPNYAPASNDLGYTWADRGENLNRAEALIRVAVKEEPDNQSYLDSLGWVLYKRGKFEEARQRLDEAIAPASFPDPVVLDHLGDTLYRLGKKSEAIQQWKRSQQRLSQTESDREELKQLRLQLQQKLHQADANQSVTVAPTTAPSK